MVALYPAPKFTLYDNNGDPAVGWKVNTYEPGTVVRKATYTTAAGGTANANPVILDARGEANIWWTGPYKVVVTDADDNIIYTVDNYSSTYLTYPTKAAVKAIDFDSTSAGTKVFITSDDGGEFTVRYNATPTTYDDDGGSYCGTQFIPTGGDGTIGIVRDFTGGAYFGWYGAKGDDSTDDTNAVKAAFASGQKLLVGHPDDVYKCTSQITVPSNTTVDGKYCTFKRYYAGAHLFVNTTEATTWSDSNITFIRVKGADDATTGRGGFISFVGVTNLNILDCSWVGNAPYDAVYGANAFNISGTDVIMSDIYIDNSTGGQWADGIHIAGGGGNIAISNCILLCGDDCIGASHRPGTFSNRGAESACVGIAISNLVCKSEIANAIRFGAASVASEGTDAQEDQVWKNVTVDNVVVIDNNRTGAGRYITLDDRRAAANIADVNDDITISNVRSLDSGTAGQVAIFGNQDVTSATYTGVHNYGKVVFHDLEMENDGTGTLFYGGGADEVIFNGGSYKGNPASSISGAHLQFYEIDSLIFNDVEITGDTTGSAITFNYVAALEILNPRWYGSNNEFALVSYTTNATQTLTVFIQGGYIKDSARLFRIVGTDTFTSFIVDGTDFTGYTTTRVQALTATRSIYNFSEEIATSDGTTGGTGSAGAGNQYVELVIGGTTYKVLHDGTV